MNSKFCVIWAGFNHFETRLMVLSQKVESNLLRMASLLKNFAVEKGKMASEIVQILDIFLNKFWYTDIQVLVFAGDLDKWIILVDIPTEILLTKMA